MNNITEVYQKPVEDVMKTFDVSNQGLTDFEVRIRQKKYGFNEIQEAKKKSVMQVFLEQFNDFLVIILLVAAIISAFLQEVESSIVIFVVIALNAVLGTIQHIKAEKSLDSLKEMAAPIAKVIRNGQIIEIPSREVIVGDILSIEAGDFISADGRIIESNSLQINESSLTGESLPIDKIASLIKEEDVPLGDKKNMVFSGSYVTNGRGQAIVTSIGMDTEIGKIANLLDQAKEKKTPLQESLEIFGKRLAVAIIIICLIILVLDVLRGRPLVDSFMFAVSLAVAAIPEALSSIVTIVLAFGTQKMAKENAIVRKLHAVESLGSISVICSDKTGTLTQNKMTAQQIFINGAVLPVEHLQENHPSHKKFLYLSLLCNNSISIDRQEIGDPTELALVNMGKIHQLNEIIVRELHPKLDEIPFDSKRKLMSTVNKSVDGKRYLMITKGAVDVLISKITKIETAHGIVPIKKEHIEQIKQTNHQFSNQGLRVLAITYKEVRTSHITVNDENHLTFLGLVAMMDPPREESKQAVEDCIKAGIKPVMITGDHKITASAIAKELGILKNSSEAMEGKEIEELTDQELQKRVAHTSVFARVSPEHKIRIVQAWQEKGHVVAMTGDGVNDAPALKQSNVGVAMGQTGTEVAKDASSIVLTDDNFSTIVKAIANGRSLYANIKNAIQFLLSGNTGAILVVLYATLFALPAPFAPVHLLFINLLTDSLPAIAIGLEPHNERLMKEKPRNVKEPLLNREFAKKIGWEGLIIAAVTIIGFQIGLSSGDPAVATTMAFAILCLSRLFHGFNCRSSESLFKIGLFTNITTWIAFLAGVVLLNVVLIFGLFEVAKLTSYQLILIYGLSFIPLIIIQFQKIMFVHDDK